MSIDNYDVAKMRVMEQYKPSVYEINEMAGKIKLVYPDPAVAREMLDIWVEEETMNRIQEAVDEGEL